MYYRWTQTNTLYNSLEYIHVALLPTILILKVQTILRLNIISVCWMTFHNDISRYKIRLCPWCAYTITISCEPVLLCVYGYAPLHTMTRYSDDRSFNHNWRFPLAHPKYLIFTSICTDRDCTRPYTGIHNGVSLRHYCTIWTWVCQDTIM